MWTQVFLLGAEGYEAWTTMNPKPPKKNHFQMLHSTGDASRCSLDFGVTNIFGLSVIKGDIAGFTTDPSRKCKMKVISNKKVRFDTKQYENQRKLRNVVRKINEKVVECKKNIEENNKSKTGFRAYDPRGGVNVLKFRQMLFNKTKDLMQKKKIIRCKWRHYQAKSKFVDRTVNEILYGKNPMETNQLNNKPIDNNCSTQSKTKPEIGFIQQKNDIKKNRRQRRLEQKEEQKKVEMITNHDEKSREEILKERNLTETNQPNNKPVDNKSTSQQKIDNKPVDNSSTHSLVKTSYPEKGFRKKNNNNKRKRRQRRLKKEQKEE